MCIKSFSEAYFKIKKLIPELIEELPVIEEYVFLNEEKFCKEIERLTKFSALEQEILVQCIQSAEVIIAAHIERQEKYDCQKIFHAAVNRRVHSQKLNEEFVSLLGCIFGTRASITKKKRGAVIKQYGRRGRLLSVQVL